MQPLLFVHIPKTGGMSLYKALAAHFAEKAIRFGSRTTMQEFHKTSLEELCKYWLVSGHLSLSDLRHKGLSGPAIAIVRDPVQRFISAYRYVKQSDISHHDDLKRQFSSPEVFVVRTETMKKSNVQCVKLSDKSDFESTLSILETNSVLAVPLEKCSCLVDMLARNLGLDFNLQVTNVTPKSDEIDFNEKHIQRLENCVKEDRKLHTYLLNNYKNHIEEFEKMNMQFFEDLSSKIKS